MRENIVNEALQSWDLLNRHTPSMDEDELRTALNVEVQFSKRKHFLIRIHARYCKLRNARERIELLAVCDG